MQQLIPVPQLPLETLLLVKNLAILILVFFVIAVSLPGGCRSYECVSIMTEVTQL